MKRENGRKTLLLKFPEIVLNNVERHMSDSMKSNDLIT